MDLRTLETFLHVIRSGAVGKTALRLNVTQSAISRRLHGLEKELGVKLFTPEGRGIRPTNAATSLIPEIEAAIKTLEAIKFKDPNVSSEATVLRVAATPQTITSLLAPSLPRLVEAGIAFSFIEAGGAEIVDLILQDVCDCGVTAQPAFETGLQSQAIGKLHLNVIGLDVRSESAKQTTVDIRDLFRKKLLLLDRSYQSRKILDAAFAMENQPMSVAYEGQSADAILSLAKFGAGVAVLPSNIQTELPTARLVFQDLPLEIETTLIWRQSSRRLSTIEMFNNILQQNDAAPR
jgi:DNA-binding transcriptional LysR family regulator